MQSWWFSRRHAANTVAETKASALRRVVLQLPPTRPLCVQIQARVWMPTKAFFVGREPLLLSLLRSSFQPNNKRHPAHPENV
jgi:hypothetical protein